MRIFGLVGVLIFWIFTGCSVRTPPLVLQQVQQFEAYTHGYQSRFEANVTAYETKYFEPWHYEKAPKTAEESMWPFRVYATNGDMFGNTLQKREERYFRLLEAEADFNAFDTLHQHGITTAFTSLRNFPTDEPLFRDPQIAGEGFPFDYNQNSAIHANEPLYLSHYSLSKRWVYAFTSYASGWIRSREMARITPLHVALWEHALQVHIIADNIPLYGENEHFVLNGRIGMILPLTQENEKNYTLLYALRNKEGFADYGLLTLPKAWGSTKALTLEQDNVNAIGNALLTQEYGWGGIFEDRDCSSMLRDYFSVFGIWLPRNSYQQSRMGTITDLKGLSSDEKREMIRKKAVPFETLLYKKGHIMLYLGMNGDDIFIFHDTWGVKTLRDGKEGRYIIGKSIISTLELGSNLEDYDSANNLLTQLESFNILTR